jgi:hypothetical protein
MDHELIVAQLLARCPGCIATMWQGPDLHRVATASLAIFEPMRQVAREMLQAKSHLEAQPRKGTAVVPCGPQAGARYVQTRTVSPQTCGGEVCIPVRTFPCDGCGATRRPDDHDLGVPAVGDCTDAVRALYAPVVAELPHRVANDLLPRCTGVPLSSRGAQGLVDRTAQDLQPWQAARETQEAEVVADVGGAGDSGAALRGEVAMKGVMAPSAGRWPAAKVATLLGRRFEAPVAEPTLGAVLARRDVGVWGAAEALAACIPQVIRAAHWERLPVGEIRGDGAGWIGKVADRPVPGVRPTRDDDHLSEHLDAVANLHDPHNPTGATAWVDQHRGALLMHRVGEVLRALERLRPWQKAIHDALAQLIGDVERTRTRIRSRDPWHTGRAVGSGAVEGGCKPVIHSRFKRAGMRWKQPGCLHVLA